MRKTGPAALRALGAAEALVGDLHGEHAVMLRTLQSADVALATSAGDPNTENAEARDAVAQLATVVEEHTAHEERDLEPSPPPTGAHPR